MLPLPIFIKVITFKIIIILKYNLKTDSFVRIKREVAILNLF